MLVATHLLDEGRVDGETWRKRHLDADSLYWQLLLSGIGTVANAIFEYLEIFHNRQRRHSALGMLTPIEYELRHSKIEPVA